jgi:hypothetical protein
VTLYFVSAFKLSCVGLCPNKILPICNVHYNNNIAKTGKLQLDRAIVTREVGFYALGIALLYFALQDVEPLESDPDGPNHIFISFWEAVMVFSGYILYVIVCANFEAIVGFFIKAGKAVDAAKKSMYGSMENRRSVFHVVSGLSVPGCCLLSYLC